MAAPKRKSSKPTDAAGARLLVVEARFYEEISDALYEGCARALKQAGATWDRIAVPGSLEIAPAIAIALGPRKGRTARYDGAVALGCVIRGETLHFEIVSMESARALMDLSVSLKLPIGNGIVTVDNEAQAWARARPTEGDKGGDAARAALSLIAIARGRR